MTEMTDVLAFEGRPLGQLAAGLLERAIEDLPGALGGSISISHRGRPLTVLSACGLDEVLTPVQFARGGPVPEAAAAEEPVLTEDVFADPRWPGLTRDAVAGAAGACGLVAVPGRWNHTGVLVLSAVLDRPPADAAVTTLERYEPLVGTALVVADAGSDLDDMWRVLRSRSAIEQAKGAIMAARRCDEDEAWQTLRRGSQEFNVKVRYLAVALVERLGRAPAGTRAGLPPIEPDERARRAASRVWAALVPSGERSSAPMPG